MQLTKKLPWTLSFVFEWWPHMSLQSVLRLRDYELRSNRGGAVADKVVSLKMRYPVTSEVSLREVGSDILTFTEVFKEQVYAELRNRVNDCRTVIDLGANIGLASLYLASQFPQSQ